MIRARRGMALAVSIGVVALIAILAVATLSLGGRAVQGSTIGIRDARLDGAVEYGLFGVIDQWRKQGVARLAIGASLSFPVTIPGVPVATIVTITRVGPEVFWVVAEATGGAGAQRRENVIVRARVPDGTAAMAESTTDVAAIGFLAVDSIAVGADESYEGGAVLSSPRGVVHVKGDATVAGAGSGILIVEGRLAIVGSFTFSGVIIARRGISVVASGVSVSGMIRAAGEPPISGVLTLNLSPAIVQDVLFQWVTPVPVAGRRWAEIF